jgi:hypothetical protein
MEGAAAARASQHAAAPRLPASARPAAAPRGCAPCPPRCGRLGRGGAEGWGGQRGRAGACHSAQSARRPMGRAAAAWLVGRTCRGGNAARALAGAGQVLRWRAHVRHALQLTCERGDVPAQHGWHAWAHRRPHAPRLDSPCQLPAQEAVHAPMKRLRISSASRSASSSSSLGPAASSASGRARSSSGMRSLLDAVALPEGTGSPCKRWREGAPCEPAPDSASRATAAARCMGVSRSRAL